MIQQIQKHQLSACLEIIHRSFATVADDFGLTAENCPTNGAFIPLSRLQSDYDKGSLMFALYADGEIIGFMEIAAYNNEVCAIEKLAVLPEYRHYGYGKRLLDYAKQTAADKGYAAIHIGIIEENTRLKSWYADNGFVHTGTKVFPHLPFTVGFMQWVL